MDKLILVLYVDVGDKEGAAAEDYVQYVASSLFPEKVTERLEATTFVIPRKGGGTVIESINPKFILDQDLYRDYRLRMDVLNEHIDHFTNNTK